MISKSMEQLVKGNSVIRALFEEGKEMAREVGAENVYDLLHPKNIRTYIKTLTSDEHLRRVLSTEFAGLMDAARKTKAKFEGIRESQLLLEDSEASE